MKEIGSDNGTEIVQDECGRFFREKGIVHQRSIHGVPQQNGRVRESTKLCLNVLDLSDYMQVYLSIVGIMHFSSYSPHKLTS